MLHKNPSTGLRTHWKAICYSRQVVFLCPVLRPPKLSATKHKNAMWKKIEGYEKYSVSDSGEVRNDETGRILKQTIDKDDYRMVTLHYGKKRWVGVARLVAEAFVPNPNNYPQINHKDENKSNNSAENLEWCTASYNTNYGTRNSRCAVKMGKTVYQFQDDELVGIWQSTKLAGKVFGISPTNIADCARGIKNSAGGYKWSYVSPLNNNQNAA